MVLRPGKTPGGVEVCAHIRRLYRRIRGKWPNTQIVIRGDVHYARSEAMDFCEKNVIQHLFGLAATRPLHTKVREVADGVATIRDEDDKDVLRDYTELHHKAGRWKCECRVVARILADTDLEGYNSIALEIAQPSGYAF